MSRSTEGHDSGVSLRSTNESWRHNKLLIVYEESRRHIIEYKLWGSIRGRNLSCIVVEKPSRPNVLKDNQLMWEDHWFFSGWQGDSLRFANGSSANETDPRSTRSTRCITDRWLRKLKGLTLLRSSRGPRSFVGVRETYQRTGTNKIPPFLNLPRKDVTGDPVSRGWTY